ncbi:MAG: hypothetical protein ABL909_09380, partial [Sphingopyxis sp.]
MHRIRLLAASLAIAVTLIGNVGRAPCALASGQSADQAPQPAAAPPSPAPPPALAQATPVIV